MLLDWRAISCVYFMYWDGGMPRLNFRQKHLKTQVASSLTCPFSLPVATGQLLTRFYLK